ncbi:hypothetical protein [Nostoc sp. 106C]|uniref:hypothetical protein n=1 Tax=Nostoc sp. 106C TaxID=1932667 RepID=UPI000A3C9603|nr:hypothetical protein [Nostoc sp. 106C]OUL26932.1 hypothetical protein BV375_20330 [Nostoc sp. 106C]
MHRYSETGKTGLKTFLHLPKELPKTSKIFQFTTSKNIYLSVNVVVNAQDSYGLNVTKSMQLFLQVEVFDIHIYFFISEVLTTKLINICLCRLTK